MNLKMKMLSAVLSSIFISTAFIGCGAGSEKESSAKSSVNLDDPAWKEAVTTPYGKYPEPVKYTFGKITSAYQNLKGTEYEKDDDSNSAWTRYMKAKLNVVNENKFVANSGDDYAQKVSMAIVSHDIPDIMTVPDYETLKELYENDMIEDLSEAYENCASDRIKEIYDSYDGRCLDTAKFDGKLMALPTTEISHGPGILWLRKDWMDKLGLKEPKTMDDVENILKNFIDKDPGQNGAGNTVGLVVGSEVAGVSGGPYMVNNIFALYGAYPKQWIDDGNGKAVYGSIQPGMKKGLEKLSQMYSKGLIDKQMAVRTADDCKALLTSGKSGAVLDNWWGSWTVMDTLKLDPNAEWVPYCCPVGDDGAVTMFTGNPNSSYIVVRKGYEHPEVLIKLADVQFDYSRYQDKDEKSTKEITDYKNLNIDTGILNMNIDYFDAMYHDNRMENALETGDTSKLSVYEMSNYNSYKNYSDSVKNGTEINPAEWANYNAMKCANMVKDLKIKEVNPIFFGNTQSMSLKWPTLDKMEQEMYLKIITGEERVDYFDKFVESWKQTGGDQITEEVNAEISKK